MGPRNLAKKWVHYNNYFYFCYLLIDNVVNRITKKTACLCIELSCTVAIQRKGNVGMSQMSLTQARAKLSL